MRNEVDGKNNEYLDLPKWNDSSDNKTLGTDVNPRSRRTNSAGKISLLNVHHSHNKEINSDNAKDHMETSHSALSKLPKNLNNYWKGLSNYPPHHQPYSDNKPKNNLNSKIKLVKNVVVVF